MHNGGYHDFPLKNFSRVLPKIFVGDRFVYQKSSCMEKIMKNRCLARFAVKNVPSYSAE